MFSFLSIEILLLIYFGTGLVSPKLALDVPRSLASDLSALLRAYVTRPGHMSPDLIHVVHCVV